MILSLKCLIKLKRKKYFNHFVFLSFLFSYSYLFSRFLLSLPVDIKILHCFPFYISICFLYTSLLFIFYFPHSPKRITSTFSLLKTLLFHSAFLLKMYVPLIFLEFDYYLSFSFISTFYFIVLHRLYICYFYSRISPAYSFFIFLLSFFYFLCQHFLSSYIA